ncbi:MAG: 4-(cytidine 5'-diphospho)-2-C-methyl-D-erythritol kinase [Hyphomonas sp.]|uniref:4-(cytidine 5'-diphospho)-2-C-methyl-D-erythritol kinase n=1 Tax=Hyphomonas sp. TaxID=87 RepID=UPI0018425A47|nr:4-(cytidine 5'-diphospho)-2-C-methyl-D-erythritol kinase [Hyphomonas sp.]MBU3922479.1 4-(cytidine 5'-diphospho)-2-C-methyl-D-erythritol kinase [Alphaproteobacteria bacterium]MBA3069541.1 4-(cytidine 5'-diphospho)-2-C-methyl-D-erythritol kinase [Hyphomonas sp.]MBU4063298.1 4-(cytidine 5'-diphospho)-2-C-methyl-D-erythritol kinase [Alphaproteobacteria bacterium]MBU4164116.1 4-(cytidine 5'-diphospho)-2-C-methyl-D-erythritol kinase [Alphaproteobacteria bacterium]MBU4567649.1 4-(cytidine 5'-dipho
MTSLKALAPAKVNLFLHVGAVKPNGRHDLDSLVVFSDGGACDHLAVEAAGDVSLTVSGPGAGAAGPEADNLVLRAARALQVASGAAKGAKISLGKWLPVAAGIGGGSSDAAAALRLLTRLWEIDPAYAVAVAPGLGGDVAVALAGVPALMRGEGERVTPVPLPGPLPALLVNPGVACPTGPIFKAYDAAGGGAGFSEIDPLPEFSDAADLAHWLGRQRNDLEAPAAAQVPEIGRVLGVLRAQPGVRLARMSGSGATCFALFDTIAFAERTAVALNAEHPGWWSAPCRLGAVP